MFCLRISEVWKNHDINDLIIAVKRNRFQKKEPIPKARLQKKKLERMRMSDPVDGQSPLVDMVNIIYPLVN